MAKIMNPQVDDVSSPVLKEWLPREYHQRQTILIDKEKSLTLFLESQNAYKKHNTAWKLCLYGNYSLVGLYQKSLSFAALARSISDAYQLVRKYRTNPLYKKYSTYA